MIEKQINDLALLIGIGKITPCGYAFLNTPVAEVLFRGGHGMVDGPKPVYDYKVVVDLLEKIQDLNDTVDRLDHLLTERGANDSSC